MDLEVLRTFVEVYRHRSFSAAARSMFLSQAAISARIKLLERDLGVQLIERDKGGVQLTAPGARLLDQADLMVANWRRIRHDIAALGEHREQLAIGGSLRLWDILLQHAWLQPIRQQMPQIFVSAHADHPERLTRLLLEGVIDVAVVLEPANVNSLTIKPLGEIELLLVSTVPNQSADEALSSQYVQIDWGGGFRRQFALRHPQAPLPVARVSTPQMALAQLDTIGGSAYLPWRMVRAALKYTDLHPTNSDAGISRTVHAVYRSNHSKLALIAEALTLLDLNIRHPEEKAAVPD